MTDPESQKHLASALGRIPSGLFILTARRGDLETGLLTSWVQQCGFDPPSISLAVKRDREILAWLTQGSIFTLNVLDDSQTDMIVHFGRGFALTDNAFKDLEIDHPDQGDPVLAEALAYLRCQVASRCPAGDHDLIIARVIDGRLLGNGHPMVHIRKSGFHY
jgi:flavin reductase (DIM6/NTAB) family NADH-FMN oxidoreductase RutF